MQYLLYIGIVLSSILFSNCGTEFKKGQRSEEQFATYKLDTSLKRDLLFSILDRMQEPFSLVSLLDTTRKKATSSVTLVTLDDIHNRISVVDKLRCRAWLTKETLQIHLSNSDGFSGSGINIIVKDTRFNALPFESTDLVIQEIAEPHVTVEKQQLTLHQATFAIGDSVYGELYLRTLDSKGIKKYAQGLFRTRIENSN